MKKIIILMSSLMVFMQSHSQQYHFKNYSIDKGLPNSTIYSIIQDSRGYLWLGSDGGGLSGFDGISFITYNTNDGLIDNSVRSLLEDSEGNIWVGTMKGISLFNGIDFLTLDESKGIPEAPVWCIFEDSKQNIWAGSLGRGLYNLKLVSDDSVKVTIYTKFEHDLVTNFIFDIYEHDNFLYLALVGGINILSFSDDTTLSDIILLDTDEGQIPSNRIQAIEEDANGDLWFATFDAGVFKLVMRGARKGEVITYDQYNGFNDNMVWDILKDNKGGLWFAANENGLVKQTKDGFKSYSKENGFAGNQVMTLFEDTESAIWAGTLGDGISQFFGEDFIHLTEEDDLVDKVLDIEQDKYGNYWLASDGSGLIKLSFRKNGKPKYTHFTTDDGLSSNFLTTLSIAPDGNIWVGYQKEGISKFDGRNFKHYNYSHSNLLSNYIVSILADSKGFIWIGTNNGMVFLINEFFQNFHEEEQGYLLFNDIQTIIEDKKGNIYFGTYGGLLRKDSVFSYFDEEEGLNHKEIKSLAEDHLGYIWIGTLGGGLYRYDPFSKEKIVFFQMADERKLASNNINSLIFENDSILIVGTDKGFDKLLLDDEHNILDIVHYDQSNGFIGVENNLNSIYKDNSGNIWFGTVKGLTKYNPANEIIDLPAPKIHITNIDMFYESVDWLEKTGNISPWFNRPQQLKLKYNDNHLTFKYSGIYLNNPEKISYSYILEGLDENWSPLRSEGSFTYPGLPHGDYTFKVQAINDRGVISEEASEFKFTIKPPFWKTTWFILLTIVEVIVIIIIYIKWRERKLQEDKRILEQKVKERTVQIRKQNEEIAAQKEHIEHLYKEVTDSIHYAEKIQTAILPSHEYADKVLKDHFILFRPRDIVSGDFFWLTEVNQYKIFTAADCTGHGVPGAFMSLLGVSFLNDIVNKRGITTSGKVLNELRKYIISSFQQKGDSTERKEGMDIALSILDTKTNTIQFSGAYNPLYIVRKKGGTNTLTIYSDAEEMKLEPNIDNEEYNLFEIKADKMPAAIYVKMNDFASHRFPVKKGDTLYMFSDGFADQFGGPNARKYMSKAMKRYFLTIQDLSMEEQKESLNTEHLNWMEYINPSSGEKFSPIDDVVIMGVKI